MSLRSILEPLISTGTPRALMSVIPNPQGEGSAPATVVGHQNRTRGARVRNDTTQTKSVVQDDVYSPPSKIFFDRYLSAASGIIVTTRLPLPSLLATWIAAKTLAPALDPPRIPSSLAISTTVSKASLSLTMMISSHTLGSNVLGMKLLPMPSTLCGPGGPPPSR